MFKGVLYVGVAVLTAFFATVVGAVLMTPTASEGDPERMEFAQAVIRYVGWTLPAGLTGGFAFLFLNPQRRNR